MLKNKKLLIVIIAVFLFLPQLASAIESGTISIKPAYPDSDVQFSNSWFIYNLGPGESKEDACLILNNGEEPVTVEVYSVDATTTIQGSFAPGDSYTEPSGVGSWVAMSGREFVLEPNSELLVPFTITIPETVDVGDHMGAVIIQKKAPEPTEAGGTGVSIVTRVGVRIYQTVPGEVIKDLDINSLTWRYADRVLFEGEVLNNWLQFKRYLGFGKPASIEVEIANKGNNRLLPKGHFTLTNIFGQISHKQESDLGEIFPGETNNVPVSWHKPWPALGRFVLRVEATFDQELPPEEREIVIWVLPYNLIFILIILAVLIILIRLTFLLVMVKKRKKWATHVVQPEETLADIAVMYSVKWKKVAKVNKLKKPFSLSSGQILWIPGVKKKKEMEEVGTPLPQEAKEGKTITIWKWDLTPTIFWSSLSGLIIVVLAVLWFVWLDDVFLQPTVTVNANVNANTNVNVNTSLIPQEALDRDIVRKSDLAEIQEALERYKTAEGQYPLAEDRDRTNSAGNRLQVELQDKGHLLELPVDPLDPQYYYGYLSADGSSYEITAVLENTEDPEGILVNDFYLYQLAPTASEEI
ncbi:MAG: DUF916 domain-containing protein [Patescibacteria group bacterium]